MVSSLYIYPIKSLGGSRKQFWKATSGGFEFDRNWMLIDSENQFITQREIPALSSFFCDVIDGQVHVLAGDEKISWEADRAEAKQVETKVWDDVAYVRRVDKRIDHFFSDLLGHRLKLVRQVDRTDRQHFSEKLQKKIPVSLADGYPYLIIGTKSFENLNDKLNQPVLIDRFRPNIVLETNSPHEEDEYDKIYIGEVPFLNLKPCARCMIINIDQQTAQLGKEPTATLSTYRKRDHKLYFGTNMMCLDDGMVSVGDHITFQK